jgi:hypothetical protein
MSYENKVSPSVVTALICSTSIGIGASIGVALDNLPVWLVVGACAGSAIGGTLLISGRLNRFIFVLLLTAISSVLLVSLSYANSGRVIKVNLSVQEGAAFSQDWPVFVYASAPGSKLPLSSTRVKLSELPATLVLTEAMYVLPNMTMKGHRELVVTAKVSSSSDVHETGPEDTYSLSSVLQFSGPEKRAVALLIKAAE